MENLPRSLIVCAIILGGAHVIRGLYPADRFTMIPAASGATYRLDRLTGSILYCDAVVCRPLALAIPVMPKPAPPAQRPTTGT
jgi:hypothetical protein